MNHCCIGIMAYNEEANIGRLLEALLAQKTNTVAIDEIVVVASGCTDRTEEIVLGYTRRFPQIRMLRQAKREGKASAVNLLLRNTTAGIVVLESADTIPLENTIEALVSPLADPQIGMVGGRPVPTNSTRSFLGYGVHLLWALHHQISLCSPKMGELIAFRHIFQQIPGDSAVDEASIEPLIIGQGLRLCYVPQAVVRNKGPETLGDFIKQRRRIFAGHLYVKDSLGYRVSTLSGIKIFGIYLKNVPSAIQQRDWRYFVWGTTISFLEVISRTLATYDYVFRKRKPYAWSVVESTKDLPDVPHDLLAVDGLPSQKRDSS